VGAHVLLLRGINLGPRNRVPMGELREALSDAGFEGARTYLQSGNVVLRSDAQPSAVAGRCQKLIAERFGLEIPVVVRTGKELAAVVKRNPLGDVATNPKRYQVSFLDRKPDAKLVKKLAALQAESEGFAHFGRELYAWHPEGVARSKLWNALAGKDLGVLATARNWTTVTNLLAMAEED
jgi:uncharacterized protein (DUF1697 family)